MHPGINVSAAVPEGGPPFGSDLLLGQVRSLQRAERAGTAQLLLRGKNLGLLCESMEAPEARLFGHAAASLGARVAHVRSTLSELSPIEEVHGTARMLGRLYDAIECHGLPEGVVRELRARAGVPVFNALASTDHPTAACDRLVGPERQPGDNRRLVVQAVLVHALT